MGAALLLASAVGSLGCRGSASALERAGAAAPLSDRRCTPPTSAPDPLLVEGTLVDFSAGERGVAGGLVEARTPDGRTVARSVADAQGRFSLAIATGGRPFQGRLRASQEGLMPSNFEAVGGFGHDLRGWRQEMVASQAFAESAGDQGLQRGDGDAVVGVRVQECGSLAPLHAVGGVTVGIPEGGSVVYTADDTGATPGATPDATSAGYGLAWSYKVAPGNVHIVTTKDGRTTSYAARVDGGEELFLFDYL